MPELTLEQALELMGETDAGEIRLQILTEAGTPDIPASRRVSVKYAADTAYRISVKSAIETYGNHIVKAIRSCVTPTDLCADHLYVIKSEAVQKDDAPAVAIGVMGGIVTDIYTKGISKDVTFTVLDVDRDRPGADEIEAEWDRIAQDDPGYVRVQPEFYDPVGNEEGE